MAETDWLTHEFCYYIILRYLSILNWLYSPNFFVQCSKFGQYLIIIYIYPQLIIQSKLFLLKDQSLDNIYKWARNKGNKQTKRVHITFAKLIMANIHTHNNYYINTSYVSAKQRKHRWKRVHITCGKYKINYGQHPHT